MDNNLAIAAIVISLIAIVISFYKIITSSNKNIREEIDPETQSLLDEALELEEGIID